MPRSKKFTHEDVKEPGDLDRLDKEGLVAFLRSERADKVEIWDSWRRGTQWEDTMDLKGTDLRNANLATIDFIELHFEGADFSNANLEGAFLWEAYVEGARFTNANLRRTHLRDVDLSSATVNGLKGVRLYQAYLSGLLGLQYQQFLLDEKDPHSACTIWGVTQNRYSEANDIYKSLKGYFEDAGDYEGANWAYIREQEMERLMVTPSYLRWIYPRRKWQATPDGELFWRPSLWQWLQLEIANKLAGYGLSLLKPIVWLLVLVFGCGLIYRIGGMVTSMPGCGYADLSAAWHEGCDATHNRKITPWELTAHACASAQA